MNNNNKQMDNWYTPENIYCVYRLYETQKKNVRPIKHENLDTMYARFLSEIGARPTAVSLKDKMTKDGKGFFYNSAEDLNIIVRMNLVKLLLGGLEKSLKLTCSEGIRDYLNEGGIYEGNHMTLDEVDKVWADIAKRESQKPITQSPSVA